MHPYGMATLKKMEKWLVLNGQDVKVFVQSGQYIQAQVCIPRRYTITYINLMGIQIDMWIILMCQILNRMQ